MNLILNILVFWIYTKTCFERLFAINSGQETEFRAQQIVPNLQQIGFPNKSFPKNKCLKLLEITSLIFLFLIFLFHRIIIIAHIIPSNNLNNQFLDRQVINHQFEQLWIKYYFYNKLPKKSNANTYAKYCIYIPLWHFLAKSIFPSAYGD